MMGRVSISGKVMVGREKWVASLVVVGGGGGGGGG